MVVSLLLLEGTDRTHELAELGAHGGFVPMGPLLGHRQTQQPDGERHAIGHDQDSGHQSITRSEVSTGSGPDQ